MLLNRCQEDRNIRQRVAYEAVETCRVMRRLVVLSAIALTSELSAKMVE